MFRQVIPMAQRFVKPRRVAALMASGVVTTAAYSYYMHYNNNSAREQRVGLQRQARFWSRVVPVIVDYYWHFGKWSPYVYWYDQQYTQHRNDESMQPDAARVLQLKEYPMSKAQRLHMLHERHAPTILQVMLDLRGLYIKLGQVLSVTALPIPEAYRIRFRLLQSDVPGHEDFDVVQKVLQEELVHKMNGNQKLEDIFSWINPVPVGAASIGQAHRAILRDSGEEVIVKVQYPDAAWQVPADIQCVGNLLKVCVYAGIVDESAAKMSFEEFARQFESELDYLSEAKNLRETYESSLRSDAPYKKRGVIVPRVYEHLSSGKVITMSFLRGPKLEEEALRQLQLLGINTAKGIGSIVREAAQKASQVGDELDEDTLASEATLSNDTSSWRVQFGKRVGGWIGVDNALAAFRWSRRIMLLSTAITASAMGFFSPILPKSWQEWSDTHVTAYEQAQRLALTKSWIEALFDVHGFQVFNQGLFNADCHPGNILVIEEDDGSPATRLGLIDFGQCKRLTPEEQVKVAVLVLSVANKESDEQVAAAFRRMSVQTKNDSTEFLAEMARLMFGAFETHHLDHSYHKRLHKMDRITYFPNELSMVYRTSLLLRGLAMSLQENASVSEHWRSHAQAAVDRHKETKSVEMTKQNGASCSSTSRLDPLHVSPKMPT